MAFVDLRTEKIYGCKEGSYTWWHEKGHIEFNKSSFGNHLDFWKGNIFIWIIGVLIFAVASDFLFLKSLSVSLFLIYILMYIYEEAWAWVYSIKNKK